VDAVSAASDEVAALLQRALQESFAEPQSQAADAASTASIEAALSR
jgi:hypothetical protein